MGSPYIGEIRMFGGNFAPCGWAQCDGQLVPISENDALFTLIGTTYGGDGQETFALPNMMSRVPVHAGNLSGGNTYTLGEMGGVETVTLTTQQIPNHTHPALASAGAASSRAPKDKVPATASADVYVSGVPDQAMNAASVGPAGGSQPHENTQPFLVVHFIISLYGVFPTQS